MTMPLSINSLGRFSFSINDGAGGTVYDKEFDVIARGASDAAIRNVSDGHLIRIPLGSQVGGTIPATQAALINALIRAVSGAPSAALRFNATGTSLVGPDGSEIPVAGAIPLTIIENGAFVVNGTAGPATPGAGSYQTALGTLAGAALTTGTQTAIGFQTGYYNTTGVQTAIGHSAGVSNTTGTQTAVGHYAGYANTTGNQTAVGYAAGYSNTTGYQTAIGYQAGYTNTTGSQVAVGYLAGAANTTGSQTAIGINAGVSNTTGTQTVVGNSAGAVNTSGNQTAIGHAAGSSNTAGVQTAIGFLAAYSSTGTNVTAVGYEAGADLTTGDNVTIVGQYRGAAGLANALILATGTTVRIRYDTTDGYQFDSMAPAVSASTASTHKIPIKIGGVTYNLLATNV